MQPPGQLPPGDEPLVISLPFETRRGMTWESEATHCISGLKSLFPTQMRCILRTDPVQRSLIVIKIIKVSWWYFSASTVELRTPAMLSRLGLYGDAIPAVVTIVCKHEKHRLMQINKSRNQKTHAKTGTRPMNEGGSTQEDRNLRSNGNTGE